MAISRVIGIDFGTSTSLMKVKTYEHNKSVGAEELSDYVRFDGTNDTVPTLICYDETYKEYLIGHQAAANSSQGKLISNFKLDLFNEDESTREEALKYVKMFFEHLYEVYNSQRSSFPKCDEEVTYVSYPVKWTNELAGKMLEIAEKAGFQNVHGMDEASAAIHAVWIQQRDVLNKLNADTGNILLIDMGAGTTDLALCKYSAGEKDVEIINTWPQSDQKILFGGREIDESLWEYIKNYLKDCGIPDIQNEKRYLPGCKAWKESNVSPALGRNRAESRCGFIQPFLALVEPKPFPPIDRAVFEKMLEGYLKQFPDLVNGILDNTSEYKHADIDLVIFAGGHSQWYFTDDMINGIMTAYGIIDLPKIKSDPWRVIKLARPHESVALGMVYQPISADVQRKKQEQKEEISEKPIQKKATKSDKSDAKKESSVWKSISSHSDARDYAKHLVESLDLNEFIDSRNVMNIRENAGVLNAKLSGAMKYVRVDLEDEYAIYIYDWTVFGSSGKSGLLATTKGIYSDSVHIASRDGIPWSDIISLEKDEKLSRVLITTNTGKNGFISLSIGGKAEGAVKLLQQIWQDLR